MWALGEYHSRSLRTLLGRDYARKIGCLIAHGVVERNDSYKADVDPFTKSYRLSRQHRHAEVCLRTLRGRIAIRHAVRAHEPDPVNLGEAGMHYRSHFQSFALNDSANPVGDFHDQWTRARWQNGQEYSIRCEYGRYHSLVTQTSKLLRSNIQVTGDPSRLCLVDVSACQPILLGYAASIQQHPRSPQTTESNDVGVHWSDTGTALNYARLIRRLDGPSR